jgi:acetyl-CoA carboxylase biotin carboxyl carrier protein
VPESSPPDPRFTSRSAADRSLDHAAIDRLGDELLPALIAKLGATDLAELEVREGGWRVRLRRPAQPRQASGSGGHRERKGAAQERTGSERGDRHERSSRGHHAIVEAVPRSETRQVATSPAVGIYRPRTDLPVGERVRAGDRLGAVDMLGVAQEVIAPVDGVVGASLAESGDAVEYGQDLLVIEAMPGPAPSTGTAADA